MKKYCIDYRNGGLGNTILAHVLFASQQVELDLDNFFSLSGDAHGIQPINNTNLTVAHLLEHPNDKFTCVLQLTSQGWTEILRTKMSYSKWMKDYPTPNNYQKFFNNHNSLFNHNQAWVEFYNNVKDPSWPDCDRFENRINLPKHIQQEIENIWIEASFEIDSDYKLFEFLVITYHNTLINSPVPAFDCPIYCIDQYLSGEFEQLKKLSDKFKWSWNNSRSEQFFAKFLEANQQYLDWLKKLKVNYQKALADETFDWQMQIWENAIVIAKIFVDLKFDPQSIKWQDISCLFDNKSLKLSHMKGI